MISIKRFIFNAIEENTYVLFDETNNCVIIDAGCYDETEQNTLKNFIIANNLKPVALLNTHCHFDHVFGNAFVCREFNIESWIHKDEMVNIERAVAYTSAFGMRMEQAPVPTHFLNDGDSFKFGNSSLKIIHTPGHSPGCVCFYSEPDEMIITGDTLFSGSIGRTDLPGGDYDQIMDSLLNKLMTLPGDTTAYCGHGPNTQISHELMFNPFITERM